MARKSGTGFNPITACQGKIGYTTFGLADAALKRMRKRKRHFEVEGSSGGPIVPYRCRFCDRFHLGSGSTKRKPKEPKIDLESLS